MEPRWKTAVSRRSLPDTCMQQATPGVAAAQARGGRKRRIASLGCALVLAASGFASGLAHADSIAESVLYTFDGPNGKTPESRLTPGPDGAFYGTSTEGGVPKNLGVVYKVTTDGVLTLLHSFAGADGSAPRSGLILGKDGNFYGTTCYGGTAPNGGGTVFRITPRGSLTTLYSFADQRYAAAGYFPCGGLLQGTDGNLYGTTTAGGRYDQGTIFRMTPAGQLTTLHAFAGPPDGADPEAALIQASDGNFYGTTAGAAVQGQCCGTVFRMQPNGAVTTLVSFADDSGKGLFPYAALVQARDGNLYGTASAGGIANGTVFRLSLAGAFTKLYDFRTHDNDDGAAPRSALVEDAAGNLLGVTSGGGTSGSDASGRGVLFRIAPDGSFTKLYVFLESVAANPGYPVAPPVLGADGSIYGAGSLGGSHDAGALYRIVDTTSIVSLAAATQQTDSNGHAAVTVTVSAPAIQDISLPYTLSGTEPASRYAVAPANRIVIPAGSTSASIDVQMNSSTSLQCDHTIVLTLQQPTYAALGAIASDTIKVHNYTVQYPAALCPYL